MRKLNINKNDFYQFGNNIDFNKILYLLLEKILAEGGN